MKQIIQDLVWESRKLLESMQKTKMSLQDRINYEKALVKLEDAKKLMDKSAIQLSN